MEYIKDLIQIVGEKNVKTDRLERLCFSRDMSVHEGVPDAIVFAKTTDEISKVLKLANDRQIKVIPRGSGTSTTGAVLPCLGGIVLDVSRMNKIKEINPKDGYAVVEPGVICQHKMAGGPSNRSSLQPCVLPKRVAALRWHLYRPGPVERQWQNAEAMQQRGDLVEFPRVTGGNDQRDSMEGAQICQETS